MLSFMGASRRPLGSAAWVGCKCRLNHRPGDIAFYTLCEDALRRRVGAEPLPGRELPARRRIGHNARMRRRNLLAVIALACVVACGENRGVGPAPPIDPKVYEIDEDDRPAPGRFLRYVPPGPQGGGLDVAITDYEFQEPAATVHLVGVVHVADADYYERIQRDLDRYDIVLYEGVKPGEMEAIEWQKHMLEEGGEAGNLQMEMAAWLGFRYQMEAIDYTSPRFVHADMNLQEFDAAGARELGLLDEDDSSRGLGSTWARVRAVGRDLIGADGVAQSWARQLISETMGTMDIGASMGLVPGMVELLLIKRNEVVMERFDEQVRTTTSGSIGIFYGAAHMDDLAKRLEALGYRRTGARWLRAWALRAPHR